MKNITMNMRSMCVPAPMQQPPPTSFVNNINNSKIVVSFSAQFEDEQSAMNFARMILSVMQDD